MATPRPVMWVNTSAPRTADLSDAFSSASSALRNTAGARSPDDSPAAIIPTSTGESWASSLNRLLKNYFAALLRTARAPHLAQERRSSVGQSFRKVGFAPFEAACRVFQQPVKPSASRPPILTRSLIAVVAAAHELGASSSKVASVPA